MKTKRIFLFLLISVLLSSAACTAETPVGNNTETTITPTMSTLTQTPEGTPSPTAVPSTPRIIDPTKSLPPAADPSILLEHNPNPENNANGKAFTSYPAYYVDGKIYYSDVNNFYRMEMDGSSAIRLLRNRAISVLKYDDYLYFIDLYHEIIKRMPIIDTVEEVVLYTRAKNLNIVGETAYFIDEHNDYQIVTMGLDGGGKKFLPNINAYAMEIYGDWIYYFNNAEGLFCNIYKAKTDGSAVARLTDSTAASMAVSPESNTIYYSEFGVQSCTLYKMDTNGLNKLKLADNWRGTALVGDWIYGVYTDETDSNYLAAIRTDGTDMQVFTDTEGVSFDISVAGNWVFFNINMGGGKVAFYKMRLDGTEMTAF